MELTLDIKTLIMIAGFVTTSVTIAVSVGRMSGKFENSIGNLEREQIRQSAKIEEHAKLIHGHGSRIAVLESRSPSGHVTRVK